MSEVKARIYFIIDTTGHWPKAFREFPEHANKDNIIHVIEKSAFDALKEENAQLVQNCISLNLHESRMEEKDREIKKLREALVKIEQYSCFCSIDDEIIPQVVAREARKEKE